MGSVTSFHATQELNAMLNVNESPNPLADMPDDDLGPTINPADLQPSKWDQKKIDDAPTDRAEKLYVETCGKCKGTGIYNLPSQYGVRCFQCDGKKVLTFKTSPEERAKAKAGALARKAKKAEKLAAAFAEFEAANPVVAAWWTGSTFGFAIDMRTLMLTKGELTKGQLDAVVRCAEKFNAAKLERQAKAAATVAAAPVVDVSSIHVAFGKALAKGIKNPKLKMYSGSQSFTFSRAKDSSANAGAIYVKSEEDLYLGKVMDGKFLKSWDCTAEAAAEVLKVLADPAQAAIAYGKEFGVCSACSRTLTDPVSIAAGIGPICAGNFGF
jgi:hypothetical protein